MVGRIFGIVVACLTLAACDKGASVEEACEKICSCTEFTPSSQRACADECVAEVESFGVPQACLDCVAEMECRELEADACDPVCN